MADMPTRMGAEPRHGERLCVSHSQEHIHTNIWSRRRIQAAPGPWHRKVEFPPGRLDALLRLAPLRTGRAGFLASGSSKPRGLVGGQKCWSIAILGGVPVVAVGV